MFTIKTLADIAHISTRTLRYYDTIDLLKPMSLNESGYRIYDETSVDLLQQILFYKTLGVSLNEIKAIIYNERFDRKSALFEHKHKLVAEIKRMQTLVQTVESTILVMEGKNQMKDQEKFNGFKEKLIEENEKKYGDEARQLFNDHVDEANERLLNMDQSEYANLERLTDDMYALFRKAMLESDVSSDIAQKACAMHEKWIKCYWSHYSKEAHRGLVDMYVTDERFTTFYDSIEKGLANFIKDAMTIYLK